MDGAFATKEEAKQAFIAALKQVGEPSSAPACPRAHLPACTERLLPGLAPSQALDPAPQHR